MSNIENLQMNQIMGQEVGNYLHNGDQISLYQKTFINEEGITEFEFIIYINDERDISNKYKILRKIYGDYCLQDNESGKLIQPIRSLCSIFPNSFNFSNSKEDDMTIQSSIMDNSVESKTTVASNNSDGTETTKVETYLEIVKNNNTNINDNDNILKNKTISNSNSTKHVLLNNTENFLLNKRKYKKEVFIQKLIQYISDHIDLPKLKTGEKNKLYMNTINKEFLYNLKDGDWIFLKDYETINELNKRVYELIDKDLKFSTKDSIPKKDGKIFKELYLHHKNIVI